MFGDYQSLNTLAEGDEASLYEQHSGDKIDSHNNRI